jgi:hypothetical protein
MLQMDPLTRYQTASLDKHRENSKKEAGFSGGQLLANPVPEIATLRAGVLASVSKTTPLPAADKPMSLVADGASAVDIELSVALEPAVCYIILSAVGVSVTVLGGAATVTLSRSASTSGGGGGGANATTAITAGGPSGRSLCKGSFPLPTDLQELLTLRILLDGSVIEAFASGGRGVCSVGVPAAASPWAVLVAAAGGKDKDVVAGRVAKLGSGVQLLNATVHNMSAI